jgi:hypothetical protein
MVHLVEQELFTNPEHISSHPVISGILVMQSWVFCVVFVDHLSIILAIVLSVLPWNGFWLPLWYIQALFLYYV